MPMPTAPLLNVHLEGSMLETARAGTFPFMALLQRTVEGAGWRVAWRDAGQDRGPVRPEAGSHALVHMQNPGSPRVLSLRRAYHFPFWTIEPV
ncbi:MAG TPA: hypothetical protein PLL33_09635, partial [Paracoccus sp. (in: a-proteobacteria)]|nr:hypothetical protein [Paracoccus sp. (in: a-proteobacteria)]